MTEVILSTKLQGELAERFEEIKKFLGIANNSEVIRYLINHYYRSAIQKAGGSDG